MASGLFALVLPVESEDCTRSLGPASRFDVQFKNIVAITDENKLFKCDNAFRKHAF